jgi:phosphoglycolate phosphatase
MALDVLLVQSSKFKVQKLTKTIIWDFNGTLLDDMQVCIDCMNTMLKDRNLPAIDLKWYRDIFNFPVRDYYLSLGFDFDKEPFEIPAHQFIDLYRINLHKAPLQPGAREILDFFRHNQFQQVVLSAMEQEFLVETLVSKGILEYFEVVAGIKNHLGDGKLEMAKKLVERLGKKPGELVLIGDTVHDYEVAEGSGIRCILIAEGHQSYERLKDLNCLVLKEMKSLTNSFASITNP